MVCTVCGLFEGPFCRACRTHKRIRELLCGFLLLRSQVEETVQILRTAAGALLDLAEEAAPILARERVEANPASYNPGPELDPRLPPVDPGAAAPSVVTLPAGDAGSGSRSAPDLTEVKAEPDTESRAGPLAEVVGDRKDDSAEGARGSAEVAPGQEQAAEGEEVVKKKKRRKRKSSQEPKKKERSKRRRREEEPVETRGASTAAPPTRAPPVPGPDLDCSRHQSQPHPFQVGLPGYPCHRRHQPDPGLLSPTIHLLRTGVNKRVDDPGRGTTVLGEDTAALRVCSTACGATTTVDADHHGSQSQSKRKSSSQSKAQGSDAGGHEESGCSTPCGSSGCVGSSWGVGPLAVWRGGRLQRDRTGGVGPWREDSCDQGVILYRGMSGRRNSGQHDGGVRGGSLGPEVERDHEREPPAIRHRSSRKDGEVPSVHSPVHWRARVGRPPTREPNEAHERSRRRRRMDSQSRHRRRRRRRSSGSPGPSRGEGRRHRRERRARPEREDRQVTVTPEEVSRAWAQQEEEDKGQEAEEEEGEGPGLEEQRKQEAVEEGEGRCRSQGKANFIKQFEYDQVGRSTRSRCGNQATCSTVWGDWFGPQGAHSQARDSTRSQGRQEEQVGEEQWIVEEFRSFGGHRCRGGQRPGALRSRDTPAESCGALPWCSHRSSSEGDACQLASKHWLRRPVRAPPGDFTGLLPPTVAEASIRTSTEGIDHHLRGAGRIDEGCGFKRDRHPMPAPEVNRSGDVGHTLVSGSEAGDLAARGPGLSCKGGIIGGSKRSVRRFQSALPLEPPRRSKGEEQGQGAREHRPQQGQGEAEERQEWQGEEGRAGEQMSSWERELPMSIDGEESSSCGRELTLQLDGEELSSVAQEELLSGFGPWPAALSVAQRSLVPLGAGQDSLVSSPSGGHAPDDEVHLSGTAEDYSFPPTPPQFENVEGSHQRLRDVTPTAEKEPLPECDEGLRLSGLGPKVLQRLVEVLPLRSSTTGGGKTDIYPLPTSTDLLKGLWDDVTDETVSWVACVCVCH